MHRTKPILAAVAVSLASGLALGQVTETQKITPAELEPNDHYGCAVDVSLGLAVVGSRLDDDRSLNAGAAYLYNASTGAQIDKLIPPDVAGGSGFGDAVAIDADHPLQYVLVGKQADREEGIDAGAAYVFNAQTGGFVAKLLAPSATGGDHFGAAVAIDAGIAVVGAPESSANGPRSGLAHVYNLDTGAFLHTLGPGIPQNEALFGWSVSIQNGLVLVGSRRENANGNGSGAAYLFDAASGAQLARFTAPDNSSGDQFGYAAAMTGDLAVVSAVADGDNGAASGSAYVFEVSNPASPVMIQKLLAPDGAGGAEFGSAVDIAPNGSGYRVVVGAWRASGNDGAAYAFDLDASGSLVSTTTLETTDAHTDGLFGIAVAVGDDGQVFVGADEDEASFTNAGAVYHYNSIDAPCIADLAAPFGVLNFFDVSAFISAYNAQDPIADLAAPFGVFTFFDVAAFLDAYNAGCP